MTYFDSYRNRLSYRGNEIADAFENATVEKINQSFTQSPYYIKPQINGVDYEARMMNHGDVGTTKSLVFRPYTTIPLGGVAMVNGDEWIVLDTWDDKLYPKATIERCNETIKWMDNNLNTYSYPVVVMRGSNLNTLKLKGVESTIVPDGFFRVTIPYNENTAKITFRWRFILSGQAYIVEGFDNMSGSYEGSGYIVLVLRVTPFIEKDDLEAEIADNSEIYGTADNISKDSSNGGSSLW